MFISYSTLIQKLFYKSNYIINLFYFIYIKMSSERKEKGVIKELTEFYNNSKNFIVNCEKPDKKGKINELINLLRIHDHLQAVCPWIPYHGFHRIHH